MRHEIGCVGQGHQFGRLIAEYIISFVCRTKMAVLFTTMIERSLNVLFRKIGGFEPAALEAETFRDLFEDHDRQQRLTAFL